MPCESGEGASVATSPDADGEMASAAHTYDQEIQSPSGFARAMAVVSLVCVALLFVLVVAFLVRNGIYVVAGLGGAVLGVASGWWVVTGRGWRRTVGWAGLAAGAGLIIVALVGAGHESWASVIRLALALVLLAVFVITARVAVTARLLSSQEGVVHRVRPPLHPVLLCNPWSGGGKVERFGLQKLASSLGVKTVLLDHGLDLAELAREAIDEGADCLGMAGGDGSQALVASLAVEHELPFVCVSAGTRNHFALDLGLDREDPRKSVHGFVDGIERRVDYATVDGRLFVNNVSLGVYATIVQQEGYRDAKSETTQQLLPELLGQQEKPFDLQFVTPDGTEVDGAFLLMVSNNPYILGPSLDVSQRRRLDTGQLGVFAVSARTGAHAAEVFAMALAGRADASGHAYQFNCQEFEVHSRSGSVYAGIDGEALELASPLRFRIHPDGLRMLVPEGNVETTLRRRAREIHLKDLVSLARGKGSDEPLPTPPDDPS
jgi:diacylglycerol kinase family enzyme